MAKLKAAKQKEIMLLKELQNGDHFNILSEEAKTCVCSGFLLQKYLGRELLENNPLHFPCDSNGDLIIDPAMLRQSDIFQEAGHIRDFVAAYIARYPPKVKTPGHFKTLLNNVSTWSDLLNYVDNFFETLNDNEFLENGPIKTSRIGTEVIMTFPEANLQLVRLHTTHALDYESEKMQNCVGKGGYDKAVVNGKTHIYSLRDMSADGEWLPHTTIEYSEAKIKQIKGIKNGNIAQEYIPFVRQAITSLLDSGDIESLSNDKLSDLDKLGYIFDIKQKPHDIYNLQEEIHLKTISANDERLKIMPHHLLYIEELKLTENHLENLQFLKSFKGIKTFNASVALPHPEKTKKMLLDYIEDNSQESLRKRIDLSLLNRIGYVIDINNELQDLRNLTREIHLKTFYCTPEMQAFLPENLVSVDTLIITPSTEETFLNKFRKIKRIDIQENTAISDPIKLRKMLLHYFKSKAPAEKFGSNLQKVNCINVKTAGFLILLFF